MNKPIKRFPDATDEDKFDVVRGFAGQTVRLVYANASGTVEIGTKAGPVELRPYGDVKVGSGSGGIGHPPNLAKIQVKERGKYQDAVIFYDITPEREERS